jgi:hypothetical protein
VDISPLGDVYINDWGTYMPFVKGFVQKVAETCDDGALSLRSANISAEHIKINSNIAFIMRNTGIGTPAKPVSVPRLTYDEINFHNSVGNDLDRFADTDMSSLEEVVVTNCLKIWEFLQACMAAPVQPKIRHFVFHQLKQNNPFVHSDLRSLVQFVRASTELEVLIVLTITNGNLNLLHMLERRPPITALEISLGTTDNDGDTLGQLANLCPRIEHLGIRCIMVQSVLEEGKFTASFLNNLTAFTNELAKFPRLTTLILVFGRLRKLKKFWYGKQYPKDNRYKVVADKFYYHLVQAATKANRISVVKNICLSEESSRVCNTDESLSITCAAEHVFDY